MNTIIIKYYKNKFVLRNYCAYSSIGRICTRFPDGYKLLLSLLTKHGLNNSLILDTLNKKNRHMAPLVLVLLMHLKKLDILKLSYLFNQNDYLDIYIKKIFLNKKLTKKGLLIKNNIEFLFSDIKLNKPNVFELNNLISSCIQDINKIFDLKKELCINFIFLESIKDISAGYGNFNFVIIETNDFPDKIILHELVHNLNYNSFMFKKINKLIDCFEFNEVFTNVLTQVLYSKFKKEQVVFDTYYYSVKKYHKLEDVIRLNYLNWEKEGSKGLFLNYFYKNVALKYYN